MKTDGLVPLAKQFPLLKFAESADQWLSSVESKSIETQLAERRIVKVRIWYIFSAWALLLLRESGLWVVLDRDKPKQYFFSLGHEIGHTFHFDLTAELIVNMLTDEEQEDWYDLVEHFCDVFSRKWIKANGKAKFQDFFEKNKNTHLLGAD